jgi:branched-chain amino acid transport system ATP-binding protein
MTTVDPRPADTAHGDAPVLALSGVEARYGETLVLHDVDLEAAPRTVVALIGANGAGKTTLLRVASGLLTPTRGQVLIDGIDVTRDKPHRRLRRGLCLIPEGRGIFRSLTVRENLELQIPPWLPDSSIQPAIDAFPALGERVNQLAGSLSGGQQQMLALSRAFLSQPRIILLDEVSMGLAPVIVDRMFESLERLAATEVSLVIVEQYINRVIAMADVAYLLTRGTVSWSGPAADLNADVVMANYLGDSSTGDGALAEGAEGADGAAAPGAEGAAAPGPPD